jgi:hypothetical protein
VCVFCFPISTIKEIIQKNPKLEDIIYKDFLPILLKLNPNFKIQISVEIWSRIKSLITFKRLQKDEEFELDGYNILLIEGQIKID